MPQILLLVLLPQALRQVLPVWINTAVEIVKASTLLSIIGVGELLLKTQEIIGRTFLTLDFYVFAGLIYFLINLSIERLGRRAERGLAINLNEETCMPIERFGANPSGPGGRALPFTKAVRAGDFVFVSGQVPMGPDGEIVAGSIATQTHQTVANIKAILGELGLGLEHVVKATVWLADTRDFWPFNKVYNEYFGAALPARSCVRADMMVDCKVEIEVVAYDPAK